MDENTFNSADASFLSVSSVILCCGCRWGVTLVWRFLMVVVILLGNKYWALIFLRCSAAQALPQSSLCQMTGMWMGTARGSPAPGRSGMEERAALHVRFPGAVSLRRSMPVSCWTPVGWPKLTRSSNRKVTGGCVIHLSWAVDPLEAEQRETLCSIKHRLSHHIANVTFLSVVANLYRVEHQNSQVILLILSQVRLTSCQA